MRLAKLDENLIGQKLSIAIKTLEGKRLVNGSTEISEKLLERLKNYGMNAIYVEDENEDITLQETINEDKRAEISIKLNTIYEKIIKQNCFDEFELGKLIRSDIIPEINNEPVSIPIGTKISGYDITQHSLNVCLLCIVTGINLGLGMDKIELLAKSSLLHDIGKIIKNKETNIGHEQLGYDFLKTKTSSVFVYNLVRFHHETIDGEGPHRLSIQNQNDLIKILSLCNFYENMLSQKSLAPNTCFENIQALVNIKFDQQIYEAFRKSIYVYPTGLPVKLNNGEEGIVVRQNKELPLRPIVRNSKSEYNLLEHLSLFIESVML
jgi:HD-GYP domain-containing protein (c-di-GMP phosphodiesterase class II)